MTHNLKANTKYNVVTLSVAIPFEVDGGLDQTASLSDTLNESLRPLVLDNVIADYSLHALEDVTTKSTGDIFDEGELFDCLSMRDRLAKIIGNHDDLDESFVMDIIENLFCDDEDGVNSFLVNSGFRTGSVS